jgi:hypothetical protein
MGLRKTIASTKKHLDTLATLATIEKILVFYTSIVYPEVYEVYPSPDIQYIYVNVKIK